VSLHRRMVLSLMFHFSTLFSFLFSIYYLTLAILSFPTFLPLERTNTVTINTTPLYPLADTPPFLTFAGFFSPTPAVSLLVYLSERFRSMFRRCSGGEVDRVVISSTQ